MSDLNLIARRYGLIVAVIVGLAAGALAVWSFGLPTWLLVICLILLVFAIISLLGDLGLFGGRDTD